MFIKFEDITLERRVDVRTIEEFNSMNLFEYNIPIIDRKTHQMIKKFYPCAIFVISYGIFKNRKYIKEQLLEISDNKKIPLVVGCSRGRLRSPIMCLYARMLGINCKVLYKGIKRFFYYKNK